MKLTIEQGDLVSLLSKVVGVVEKRNTIPILEHVLLDAGEELHATATDLQIEITSSTQADIELHGSVTVEANKLLGIVKQLPKGKPVSMSYDDGVLYVSSGRSRFKFATLDAENFPHISSDEYENEMTIQSYDLHDMLDKTKFAMSTEETRYYLNGVYLHFDDNLKAVATDGHKFAMMESPESDVSIASVIIPSKTVNGLARLLADSDMPLRLFTSETKVKVECDDFTLVSKVVDGTYPDYTRIIPSHTTEMKVCSKEFKVALSRVIAMSTDKTKVVKVSVMDGLCKFTVEAPNGETAEDEIYATYTGGELTIGFNSKYLNEMMQQSEGNDMTVYLGGSTDAAVFEIDGIDGFTGIAMPMRVS